MSEIKRLSSPPRTIPLKLKLNVLFGGFMNQFGWFFFGFGMIFFWIFVMNADLKSWYKLSSSEQTRGTVTYCEETNMEENETEVYEIGYEFIGPDKNKYKDRSYSTGRYYDEGKEVQIEYASGDPFYSRIKGMRREAFGPAVLFVVLFPFIGLCFVYNGLKKGFKACRLLEHGLLAYGKLISKDRTNTRINEQMVYKMTFEFQTADGRTSQAVTRTHLTGKLEDEEQEKLVYDPGDISNAVMIDDLPGSPEIDSRGDFDASSGGFQTIIIPALSVFGHGFYLVYGVLL